MILLGILIFAGGFVVGWIARSFVVRRRERALMGVPVKTPTEVLDELRKLILKNSEGGRGYTGRAFVVKIDISTDDDGDTRVILSEVYSGVGVQTTMGLFAIAQRDDGIEVLLDGRMVWTSHEIGANDKYKVEYRKGGSNIVEWKLSPHGGMGWPKHVAEETATMFRQDGYEARIVRVSP